MGWGVIFQANSAFFPFEGASATGFMVPEKQKDRAGRFPFFSELGYNPYEAGGFLQIISIISKALNHGPYHQIHFPLPIP